MTNYEEIKLFLEKNPKARERMYKNKAIGYIISKKFNGSNWGDLVGEVLTSDRSWRKVLEENPHLRGKDYASKDRLEKEKQLELGYNVTL